MVHTDVGWPHPAKDYLHATRISAQLKSKHDLTGGKADVKEQSVSLCRGIATLLHTEDHQKATGERNKEQGLPGVLSGDSDFRAMCN